MARAMAFAFLLLAGSGAFAATSSGNAEGTYDLSNARLGARFSVVRGESAGCLVQGSGWRGRAAPGEAFKL